MKCFRPTGLQYACRGGPESDMRANMIVAIFSEIPLEKQMETLEIPYTAWAILEIQNVGWGGGHNALHNFLKT